MSQTEIGGQPAQGTFESGVFAPLDEFDLDIRLGESWSPSLHLCEKTQEASGCGGATAGCGATEACTNACPRRTIGCTYETCQACTAQTNCEQNTCATCETCGNTCGNQNTCAETCNTCKTFCDQETCNTCNTCRTECEQATCAKGTCVGCRK